MIFAVGLGHRASINLKLARYQKDSLKAYYLAKSGINKAIKVLQQDENDYDGFNEPWSTGKDAQDGSIFDNVQIRDDYQESFSVKYLYDNDTSDYRCMSDEERRININGVDAPVKQQVLFKLFESAGIDNPEEFKKLVVNWIDDNPQSQPDEEAFLKDRPRPLKAPEVLLLILEYYYEKNSEDKTNACKKAREAYDRMKDLSTVYPDNGKMSININTASEEVLEIISSAILEVFPDSTINNEADTENLIQAFRSFRLGNGYFINTDIKTETLSNKLKLGDNATKIIAKLVSAGILSAVSTNFRIASTGTVGNINKKITAIYDRGNKKVVYWHES